MSMNHTDSFLEAIFTIRSKPLPDAPRLQAKKCLIDYLGVVLAGSKMLSGYAARYLDGFSLDQGEASVIGRGCRTSMCNAALLNGINAHVMELDDGHRYCMMHPGASILSALLPIVQVENVDPNRLLLSIVVGYDAAIRIARTVQPGHKKMGYHATGTCATVGAAMAVACAMDLDYAQTKHALSAAVGSMAGLLELIEDSSNLKPYNAGRSAMNGLVSANLARSGFVGPDDILGGKRGFLAVMSDRPDPSQLSLKAGCSYGIEGIYMKPFAACRYSHAPIQAVLALRKKYDLQAQEIQNIVVDTYDYAVLGHDHTDIAGSTSAKMSIPYSVAVALVTGDAGIEAFMPPWLEDPGVLALTHKITVCANDELSALTPEKRAAIVKISARGQTFTERVDYPFGEPENPLSSEDIEAKFISLATYGGISRQQALEIIDMVYNLENRLGDLLKIL